MGAYALRPSQPLGERRRARRRRPETGRWGSVFEYCRGKCRTSSKSTVHENAYLSPLHHCFSASGARLPARCVHAARPCATSCLLCGHSSVRASSEGHRHACAHCMLHGRMCYYVNIADTADMTYTSRGLGAALHPC